MHSEDKQLDGPLFYVSKSGHVARCYSMTAAVIMCLSFVVMDIPILCYVCDGWCRSGASAYCLHQGVSGTTSKLPVASLPIALGPDDLNALKLQQAQGK